MINKLNHEIFKIDVKYRKLLKIICKNSIEKFVGLPIQWEDLYYEFLMKIPELLKKYDKDSGVKTHTYIGLKCKYFSMNKCRSFARNSHKTMNFASSAKTQTDSGVVEYQGDENDAGLDLTELSRSEKVVYNKYILEGMSLRLIARTTTWSFTQIRNSWISLKQKIINQMQI